MTVTNQDLTTALAHLGKQDPDRVEAFDTLTRYLTDPHVMRLHARSHSSATLADVEDVTSALLVDWWGKRAQGFSVTSSPRAYLATVVFRKLVELFARKRVGVLVEDFGALVERHEPEHSPLRAGAGERDLLADMPTLWALLRSESVDDLMVDFVEERVLCVQSPSTRERDARAMRDQLDLTLGRTTYARVAMREAGPSANPDALTRAVNATHTRVSRMRRRLRATLEHAGVGGTSFGLTRVELSFLRAWLERVLGV